VRARRRGWRRVVYAKTVIFNLDSGETIRGAVVKEAGALIVLANAELVAEGGHAIPSPLTLDGQAIIDTGRIRFAQIVT
jgi:hypothetical protein